METKKYKSLGLEVTETMHYGKSFDEIIIPRGRRLLKPTEAMAIWEKEQFNDWFFVEQVVKKNQGKYVARFFADSFWANLDCRWIPHGGGPALGVKFCRGLKK